MEHLWFQPDGKWPGIRVPYLCVLHYDGLGFQDFPRRHGYIFENHRPWLLQMSRFDAPLLAFLQTWLYFGLLAEIFRLVDIIIDANDFVYTQMQGNRVITTHRLDELIIKWTRKLEASPKLQSTCQKASARAHLTLALEYALYLDQPHRIGSQVEGPWAEVLLSIKVLIASLALPLQDPDIMKFLKPWHKGHSCILPTGTLWYSFMVRNGWCPFRLQSLFCRLTYPTIFFLASTASSHGRADSHANCLQKQMCIADSISKPFNGRHVQGCEGLCSLSELFRAQSEEILKIIQRGGIPLISFMRGCCDISQMQVTEATHGVPYTAVTHVWADGLGADAISLVVVLLISVRQYREPWNVFVPIQSAHLIS